MSLFVHNIKLFQLLLKMYLYGWFTLSHHLISLLIRHPLHHHKNSDNNRRRSRHSPHTMHQDLRFSVNGLQIFTDLSYDLPNFEVWSIWEMKAFVGNLLEFFYLSCEADNMCDSLFFEILLFLCTFLIAEVHPIIDLLHKIYK